MLDRLGSRLSYERRAPGTVIVREGEPGERLYLIKKGVVEVTARVPRAHEIAVAHLTKREYFGEIALLQDVPRTATVRARGLVELYSLDRATFRDLVGQATEVQQVLAVTAHARRGYTRRRTQEP